MFTRSYIIGLALCAIAARTFGQTTGICETGTAEAYLEANNVRARLPNTGGLFYHSEPHVYNIPRFTNSNAIFAGAVWVGGLVDGELRVAATRYGPNEFWPGPLDADADPPSDCSVYDRVYSVTRNDLDAYEASGEAPDDLRDWPTGLGAPTLDASGQRIDVMALPLDARRDRVIDLEAGEQPELLGDQAIWWIMNDAGNEHQQSLNSPVGLELHSYAYGLASTNSTINNSTLYRFTGYYRADTPIDSLYFGIWLDVDMGDAGDDLVGSDSLLGLGYVYNSGNYDDGGEGYGTPPPAIGLTLLEGPDGSTDGLDNNRNGLVDEPGERAHVAHVSPVYKNALEPNEAREYFYHLTGRWSTGEHMKLGGWGGGYPNDPDVTDTPINYIFPGDPATGEYWSMMNADDLGTPLYASDKRVMVSVGPLALQPGERFELTFAVVWALGVDNLDSVTALKEAVTELQSAFAAGLPNVPRAPAPDATVQLVSPGDQALNQPRLSTLRWQADPTAEAYDIEIWNSDTTLVYQTIDASIELQSLDDSEFYFWKVRAANFFGTGPWSETHSFTTGNNSFAEKAPVFTRIAVVRNTAGVLDPPDMGVFAWSRIDHNERFYSGFPVFHCRVDWEGPCSSPTSDRQQSTTPATWGLHAAGAGFFYGPVSDDDTFLGTVTERGQGLDLVLGSDYEIRFTDRDNKALISGSREVMDVPFELWDIGDNTPDSPGDDVRMVPVICESACNAGGEDGVFDIGGDHAFYTGSNDPFSDAISWRMPTDPTPGEVGYLKAIEGSEGSGVEVLSKMVLVQRNARPGTASWAPLPETGTVFRLTTGLAPPPILAAPGRGSSVLPGEVSFFWYGARYDTFEFQISTTPDFRSLVLDVFTESDEARYSLQETGTYFWRVRGISAPWSEIGALSIVESLDDQPDVEDLTPINISVYPNPFASSASIVFDTFTSEHYVIEVYDALGRRVLQPLNGEIQPGRHRVPLAAENLAGGVYFYRLSSDSFSRTGSFVVVH